MPIGLMSHIFQVIVDEEIKSMEVNDGEDLQSLHEGSPKPEISASASDVMMDFRENILPSCVEIVEADQPSSFETQRDGASFFKLAPGSYIKVNMDDTKGGLGGKMINDYTLTLDVMFESLPSDSVALFQAGGGDVSALNIVFVIW